MNITNELHIEFFVVGIPVGKERSRSTTKSSRHYTPAKTKAYELMVGQAALAKLAYLVEDERKKWPTVRQVFMDLYIEHKSGKKPDADNVVKAIQDGLTGVLWINDNNVLPRVQMVTWPSKCPRVKVRVIGTGRWGNEMRV